MTFDVTEATAEQLDEVFDFMAEWFVPEWQLCRGAAPHPTRDQLDHYLATGRPILLARDVETGELWGYRIVETIGDCRGRALWGLARHEGDPSAVTEAMADLVVAMSVYAWHIVDGPTESMMMPTNTPSTANVVDQLAALHDRSVAAYHATYG